MPPLKTRKAPLELFSYELLANPWVRQWDQYKPDKMQFRHSSQEGWPLWLPDWESLFPHPYHPQPFLCPGLLRGTPLLAQPLPWSITTEPCAQGKLNLASSSAFCGDGCQIIASRGWVKCTVVVIIGGALDPVGRLRA